MFVFAFIAWTAVASADEIGIGFTGPLSGPAAEYGQDCYNGVDMAVKEINAAGGVYRTRQEVYLQTGKLMTGLTQPWRKIMRFGL